MRARRRVRAAPGRAIPVSVGLIAGLLTPGPSMSAIAPACPATVEVAETPASVPAGFTAFVNGDTPSPPGGRPAAHALDTISFSDGSPTDIAWLAPSARGQDDADMGLPCRGRRAGLAFLRLQSDQHHPLHSLAAEGPVRPGRL